MERRIIDTDVNPSVSEMKNDVFMFLYMVGETSSHFSSKRVFEQLINYYLTHERFLYALVTEYIYERLDNGGEEYLLNLEDNLHHLLQYSIAYDSPEEMSDEKRDALEKAKKAVFKIWDYVHLTHSQWLEMQKITVLNFENSVEQLETDVVDEIGHYSDETKQMVEKTSHELSGRLITLVGIFTALAFLLFGGLTLENSAMAVANTLPLSKLLTIILIWTTGMMNIVFVLLYCIGKMTDLHFKTNSDPSASFIQKYPVVIWSNYLMLLVTACFIAAYFVLPYKRPVWILLIALLLIILIGLGIGKKLYSLTVFENKPTENSNAIDKEMVS